MALWIGIAFLMGYIFGCMHGSLLAQLLTGVNIKKEVEKNSGASNAVIVLGWKNGALVAFFDIFKGIAAVAAFRWMLDASALSGETVWLLLFVISTGVVVGHNFPFYMKFNGGKGTASIIGVMLALDWKLGLAGLVLLVAVAFATNYLVIGVLVLYVMLIVIALWPADGIWPLLISAGLFALAVWKHLENIARLSKGTEKKVSSVFRKTPAGPV